MKSGRIRRCPMIHGMSTTFLWINYFDWPKIGSTTIQFNCPLEAALSEWCVRWLVSRVHSHTSSSERHADGRGMTGEDDCVITQVQEHAALLVKFNSQTSQFQMFHSESLEWFRKGVWTPLTAPHSWLLIFHILRCSLIHLTGFKRCKCRLLTVLNVYLLCTCTDLFGAKNKAFACVIIKPFKIKHNCKSIEDHSFNNNITWREVKTEW